MMKSIVGTHDKKHLTNKFIILFIVILACFANEEMRCLLGEDALHAFGNDALLLPTAIPVLTQEEAEIANKDAFLLYQAEHGESKEKDNPVKTKKSDTIKQPVAIPELSPEDAEKANKEALKIQRDKKYKYIVDKTKEILGQIVKKYAVLLFLIPLVFISDYIFKSESSSKQKKNNKYFSLKRISSTVFSVSLLVFGVTVFVPYSVYFGNIMDFPFIFREFVGGNLVVLLTLVILFSALLLLIPPSVSDYFTSLIIGLGLCVYFQSMFMNEYYVEVMNGVEPEWSQHPFWSCSNLLIWVLVASVPFVIKRFYSSHYTSVLVFAGAILAMEIISAVSMVCSAPAIAWRREEQAICNASNQFQLSREKNIIVIILDALSSDFTRLCFEADPKIKEEMKDFIWYEDAKSYFAYTFLAIPHEMTGTMVRPANSLRDTYYGLWQSPSAKSFYKQIQDAGYDTRLYVRTAYNFGSYECYGQYFSNIIKDKLNIKVNHINLHRSLIQISGFSSMPYYLKKIFFYGDDFCKDVIEQQKSSPSMRYTLAENTNEKFYQKMISTGITDDAPMPVFSFNYTRGAHRPWNTDEKCVYHENTFDNFMPTTKGCFFLVSEFIRLLKEKGIYDQTAILVCSDHGTSLKDVSGPFDMTFMVKPFYSNNNEIIRDKTRIQSIDILPTLLQIACDTKADYTDLEGFSPSNVPSDRTRKVYEVDYLSDYPVFPGIDGKPFSKNILREKNYETKSTVQIITLSTDKNVGNDAQ